MLPRLLILLLATMVLSACATDQSEKQAQEPWPPYSQVRLKQAMEDCKEDADSIVDPPRNSANLQWDNYFTMCMKTRYGYSSQEIRKMRY